MIAVYNYFWKSFILWISIQFVTMSFFKKFYHHKTRRRWKTWLDNLHMRKVLKSISIALNISKLHVFSSGLYRGYGEKNNHWHFKRVSLMSYIGIKIWIIFRKDKKTFEEINIYWVVWEMKVIKRWSYWRMITIFELFVMDKCEWIIIWDFDGNYNSEKTWNSAPKQDWECIV